MKHLHGFDQDFLPKFEKIGGMRGFAGLPNMEDIKDIVKGFSKKQILKWTPPRRAALSDTEMMLLNKKLKLLRLYGCPHDWTERSLTVEDLEEWANRES